MISKNVKLDRVLKLLNFALLAILVGVVAGLGAVIFRGLIAFFHNLFFLGKLSMAYDANIHTPASPWGPFVMLVPVAGAIVVAFLVKNFAPEAKGHGVPEVMDAVYYHKGFIRPVVAIVKSFASAVSIGSGGSVGREGPIVQIGSSFGSTVGQIISMPAWQRNALIAAGAGGGIAATFNTPVGAVLFAIELMMHEVNVKTIVPVVISIVTATYIGQFFLGAYPSFVIPAFEKLYFHIESPWMLFTYAGLGILSGVVSTIFIKSIYAFEDFFDGRIRGNYYIRHMTGMFLVGVASYSLMAAYGHYYVEGVGYATVQDVLSGKLSLFSLLLVLLAAKLLATSLTLGSGGSGGIFSPSLYLGAMLGASYGIFMSALFPELQISPPAFAVAGMAAIVGGTTGAVMTAIVMVFEMTLDYNVIIPMTLAVAFSFGIRTILCEESIYTMKLARRGHHTPKAMQRNFLCLKMAKDIMDTRIAVLPVSVTLGEFAGIAAMGNSVLFVIETRNNVVGVITKDAVEEAVYRHKETVKLGEIASRDYIIMKENSPLLDVVSSLHNNLTSLVLVMRSQGGLSAGDITGFITKQHIGDLLIEYAELFSD